MQKVLKSCKILLCGDKHVKHEESSDDSYIYMVGRVLNYIDKKNKEEQGGECRFIVIDEPSNASADKVYDSFTVKCSTSEQIWYSNELVEAAFKLSNKHLNCYKDSIDGFFLSDSKLGYISPRPNKHQFFRKARKISCIFKKVTTIKNGDGIEQDTGNKDFFKYISENCILKGQNKGVRINLRGVSCMGICTLTKLLYLYMTKNRFRIHSLPIYFDLRYGEKDPNTKYVASVSDQLVNLRKILNYLRKRIPELTIVCFFNGLQEVAHLAHGNTDADAERSTGDDTEVYKEIKEIIKDFNDIRFVQAIEIPEMTKNACVRHDINHGAFDAFIDKVDIYRLAAPPSDVETKDFFNCYFEIAGKDYKEDSYSEIIEYLKKLGRRDFSLWQLNLLLKSNRDVLSLPKGDRLEIRRDYYKRILKVINNKFGGKLAPLEMLSYRYISTKEYNTSWYNDIKKSYYNYMLIARNPDYTSLLCARYIYELVFEQDVSNADFSEMEYISQPINMFLLACISDELEPRDFVTNQHNVLKKIGQITEECIKKA